jgi:predicted RNA binding protein YcfA (HicA-like mRNA interferase family)
MAKKDKQQKCPIKRIECLGGQLVRSKKHLIFKMPDGFTITVSKSASDHRTAKNTHADISRWERRQQGA